MAEIDFVDDPPSADIADILNAADAGTCPHGRVLCWELCGVERILIATLPDTLLWRPIRTGRRLLLLSRASAKRNSFLSPYPAFQNIPRRKP